MSYDYEPYDDQDVYDGDDNTYQRCYSCEKIIDLEDIEDDDDNCPICGDPVYPGDAGYEPREFPTYG